MEASRKQEVQSRQELLQLHQRVSQARHKVGSSMLQPRDSTVWQSRAEDRCGEWERGVLRWSGRMLDGNDLLLAHLRLLDEFLSTNRGFSAFFSIARVSVQERIQGCVPKAFTSLCVTQNAHFSEST